MLEYKIKDCHGLIILDESVHNGFYSGNKFRKMSYILRSFKGIGILTYGSKYSNHCLAAAYYGKMLNIDVVLLVLDDDTVDPSAYPNLRMAMRLGARIERIKTACANTEIRKYKTQYSNYLWIPGGGHTRAGLLSYYDLTIELLGNDLTRDIDWILLPYGTGTTSMGICKAVVAMSRDIKIFGVSVSRDLDRCRATAEEFLTEEEMQCLEIIPDYAGMFGIQLDRDSEYQDAFLQKYNVMVDPIYNIRAIRYFYEKQLNNGMIINTGGAGNLYL